MPYAKVGEKNQTLLHSIVSFSSQDVVLAVMSEWNDSGLQ
jgi:hypothetical protein